MKTLKTLACLTALLMTLSALSFAAPIVGSLGLNPANLTQNGANLSVSTIISATNLITLSIGAGDYGPPPAGGLVPVLSTFTVSNLDLTNFSSFTFNNPTLGGFTATSGSIVQQTANFLDVFVLGTYSGLPGFDPTVSSLRISVNQSGTALSGAITLNSPALSSPAPEPATMAALGSALIGLGLLRRRKLAR
jgi:hypothetical protein